MGWGLQDIRPVLRVEFKVAKTTFGQLRSECNLASSAVIQSRLDKKEKF